jgi:23S rRNA (uracil1939-C5)-methyltransferase
MISTTEKMVAGGSCITRIDGKAVFVPFSLPGETLELEITDSRKDYSFARITKVLAPSPHRVDPVCPLFGICGGCTLQMADHEYQKSLRLSVLKDVLERAHVHPEQKLSIIAGSPLEYRSRLQFHRSPDGRIGFKAASSSTIIPLDDCPVAVPAIRAALRSGELVRMARHRNSSDRFHVFSAEGKLWHEDGETVCTIPVSGQKITFDVRGFFQSNIPLLECMISGVCDPENPPAGERLLDFYSGIGTFSLFAGKNFRETVLVEHNREALTLAKQNLELRGIPATVCPVSDESWPTHPAARLLYDTAIIDPPRQGLHKIALDWFISSRIPDIRYVSCDPVTFARDAAKLVASGYVLSRVVLFDFYPQTHHIETLGFFER